MQSRRDVAALTTQTCGRWALPAASFSSWPAKSDEEIFNEVTTPAEMRFEYPVCSDRPQIHVFPRTLRARAVS